MQDKKVLVLGATGMLGQALMKSALKLEFDAIGAARSGADICLDMLEDQALIDTVEKVKPRIIINAAAVTNLAECEQNPGLTYLVNARSVGILAEVSRRVEAYLIHVSTDHYFTGYQDVKNSETSPVRLVNEYARSKFAGEGFALTGSKALVVRTNIVGFRHKKENPTFVEWVISNLKNRTPMVLFEDFFTSSIDVSQFSVALFNILDKRPSGILNIASRDVFSKKTFIEAIATDLGYPLSYTRPGSVLELGGVKRAESLGLNVDKAEKILGYKLPTMKEVVEQLVFEYKETCKCNTTV